MDIHEIYTQIRDWSNENSGILAIAIAIGTVLIGWITGAIKWIFQKIFKKDSSGISITQKFKQKSGSNCKNIQGHNITINNRNDGN